MEYSFDGAKKAVRRGTRSANHAIDIAHDVSQRKLLQARDSAEDLIDTGRRTTRSAKSAAESAHEWMEEKPHLAALAALAAGVILGALFSPRR